jgi:photosystem II stability/assembly factor-like uncharacterized protein
LQYLPNLNGQSISDVTFLDSLTGFFITGNLNTPSGINFIYKTTNGGSNWQNIYSDNKDFARIIFINSQTGFVCGGYNNYTNNLLKTTNQGDIWFSLNTPYSFLFKDMSILNEDTIWLVNDMALESGVFRSTNGGQNWIMQSNLNPDKIYMVNKNLGFIKRGNGIYGAYTGRTTNGGYDWNLTSPDTAFYDMHFIDSLVGWKANGLNIKKTTNGGLNWTLQFLPQLNYANVLFKFSFINKDTIFGVGGIYSYQSTGRGLVYKTTNGGTNWGYQLPDTSFGIYQYFFINFVDKLKGWAFSPGFKNIRTITGGADTTLYTRINNKIISVPINFELKQNYPNPYNSSTIIEYYINKQGWVKLKIFDITGREMGTLVNEVQNIGGYGIPVSINLSSGVYFYKLIYTNKEGELQTETKKMMIIK